MIAGRYRQGGPATIRLSGLVNGQPQSYTYNATFAARGGDDFIARLWAQRKIGYLLAQIRLSGVKDELVKEIVALSTRYGIVTPYTSFLVQEPQLALTQGGRDQLSRSAVAPAPTSRQAARLLQPPGRLRLLSAAAKRRCTVPLSRASSRRASKRLRHLFSSFARWATRRSCSAGTPGSTPCSTQARCRLRPSSSAATATSSFLSQFPELGRYLALGERVTVTLNGKAYAIGGEGQTAAPPAAQPSRPAAPRRLRLWRPQRSLHNRPRCRNYRSKGRLSSLESLMTRRPRRAKLRRLFAQARG